MRVASHSDISIVPSRMPQGEFLVGTALRLGKLGFGLRVRVRVRVLFEKYEKIRSPHVSSHQTARTRPSTHGPPTLCMSCLFECKIMS